MTPRSSRTAVIALILCMALPAWGGQYLLYAPQPAASGQKTPSQDGILVQEIEIQKGDTLYDLSRKFSGHGTYFPQILLFNSIKNPNLIYTGKTLKVPVTRSEAHSSARPETKPAGTAHTPEGGGVKKKSLTTEAHPTVHQSPGSPPVSAATTDLSLRDLKPSGTKKVKAGHGSRKKTAHVKKIQAHAPPSAPPAPAAAPAVVAGQKLFEAAARAYRQDDCRTAIELLDRYLADNAASPLAADANLYKADCYLRLSVQ